MNTDDKFHPLNTIQRALDYGDPLDRDEVRALIAAYEELEATHGDERDELAIRIDALEDERDALQEQLDQTQRALSTFQALALESTKEPRHA